jgi:fructuronate reductase
VTGLDYHALAGLAGRSDLRLPAADAAERRVGVVHLGVGAFHRAHQAAFTEDSDPTGEWGISAYTQRSGTVRDQLAPQDGLYTLVERGVGAAVPRVLSVIREVRAPGDEPGPALRIADPAVRVVTLTVTEKGYRFGSDGRLNQADPMIQHDLAYVGSAAPSRASSDDTDETPRTVVGQLVAGLAARRACGAGGLSVVSCDNLSGNGTALRQLVAEFCAAAGDGSLATWIDESVAFPSTVVDRIVPAATEADRQEVAALLGVRDAGVVVAEPFRQWVIEDRFAGARPAWERAGAVLTPDVAPYEAAKLRLLNGAHSLLAYTGALAGYAMIVEAVADPDLYAAALSLMVEDASPTLHMPDDFDLPAYRMSILERFANPALGHRTTQVASDGSLKLPIRLLGTAKDRLAVGGEPSWVALAVAAWMVFLARKPSLVDDPLRDRLTAAAAGRDDPAVLVDSLLTVREVFEPDLAADRTFRTLLVAHATSLLKGGLVG